MSGQDAVITTSLSKAAHSYYNIEERDAGQSADALMQLIDMDVSLCKSEFDLGDSKKVCCELHALWNTSNPPNPVCNVKHRGSNLLVDPHRRLQPIWRWQSSASTRMARGIPAPSVHHSFGTPTPTLPDPPFSTACLSQACSGTGRDSQTGGNPDQ